MLNQADNELLCRVGPGTPMGELMRRYWLPAAISRELPENDGVPLRVKLLGENLLAFRDSQGQVGLIAEACPHRGASLWFGRNEERGLRCVYHGWKFDVTGECTDMPNEPAESNFKHKIRATAYPCIEKGGVIWAYMGPPALQPPLPAFESNLYPDTHLDFMKRYQENNWLQALEGGIDSSHASFLHSNVTKAPGEPIQASMSSVQRRPSLEVVNVENGLVIGAKRDLGDGREYWRTNLFLMPFYTYSPGDDFCHFSCWVPMDDNYTLRTVVVWDPVQPITKERMAEREAGGKSKWPDGSFTDHLLPANSQAGGAWRGVANAANDYLLDREFQRTKRFSGVDGGNIGTEDMSIQETMGYILDRRGEHLGTTDLGIIAMRRMLMRAATALRDNGTPPPGVGIPEAYDVRSPGFVIDKGADWLSVVKARWHGAPGVAYHNQSGRLR